MTAKTSKKPAAKKTKAPINMGTVIATTVEVAKEIEEKTIVQPFKIDISKGKRIGDLSQEWFSRPYDDRFASYAEWKTAVMDAHGRAQEIILNVDDFGIAATKSGGLLLTDRTNEFIPSHAAFGQLCTAIGVQPNFATQCSPALAEMLLKEFMAKRQGGQMKALIHSLPGSEFKKLTALTSTSYGRIWNKTIVEAFDFLVRLFPDFKIPGQIDWSNMTHNPEVEITKDNTSLFFGDRSLCAFLCDDRNPIEAGKTSKGDTDVYFNGVLMLNSETGHNTKCKAMSMKLRGVCFNRNLWGCQNVKSIELKHYKNAEATFDVQSAQMVKKIAAVDPLEFVNLIKAARAKVIATSTKGCIDFFKRLGFSGKAGKQLIEICEKEEQNEPRTAFLASQAVSAYARRNPFNDERVKLEDTAAKILELAA